MDILENFSQSLHNGCVTIRAGTGKHEITVHRAILSRSSSPSLQKLVEGGWKESIERYIDWTHTSTEAVERVLTWLYFHDYQSPYPIPRESEEKAGETSKAAHNATQDHVNDDETDEIVEQVAKSQPVNAEGLKTGVIRPLTPFEKCIEIAPLITSHKTAASAFEEQNFPHTSFSYREALLAHVEVYSFAKYHLLTKLQELSLQRTIITLKKLDCSVKHAAQEISEVVEFVYDNVPANESNEEPMRKLLTQFAAINYTSILHGSFEALIARGGDFVLDIARKLSQQIRAHRFSIEKIEDESARCIIGLELTLAQRDNELRVLKDESEPFDIFGLKKKQKQRDSQFGSQTFGF